MAKVIKKAPSLRIVERRSWWWYAKWLLLAVLALAISFYAGRLEDRASRSRLTRQTEKLQLQVDNLQAQLRDSQSTKAMASQNNAVDALASEELRQTLKTLQDSVKELEKENAFYRGIMDPKGTQSGLQIDAFSVLSYGSDQRYRYKLTLAQLRNHENNIRGRVRISLLGGENGVNKSYDLFVLAGLKEANQPFDLRYFQNLEGELVLPAGFVARDVRVTAVADGRAALDKVFPWAQ